MESAGSAKRKVVDQSDPKVIFGNAGLPQKTGAAWMETRLKFCRDFKRDAAAATKFWRAGADFMAKLPKKPKRNARAAIGGGHHSFPVAAIRAKSSSRATPTPSIAS